MAAKNTESTGWTDIILVGEVVKATNTDDKGASISRNNWEATEVTVRTEEGLTTFLTNRLPEHLLDAAFPEGVVMNHRFEPAPGTAMLRHKVSIPA